MRRRIIGEEGKRRRIREMSKNEKEDYRERRKEEED